MLNIFSFLSKLNTSLQTVILTALVVALLGLSGTTFYYKRSYDSSIKDLSALEARYTQLETSATACSDSVQQAAADSKAKQAAADAALTQAKKNALAAEAYAQQLLASVGATGDVCVDANNTFNEYLDRIRGQASLSGAGSKKQ
jgi:hypothetical protein